VWLNIGVEKIDMHERVMVKALLNSSTTGMFMDKRMAAKHGLRLQKLERPIIVRNVNKTNNSGRTITYQVEANIYYKDHIKRMRMNVCDLGKTEVKEEKKVKKKKRVVTLEEEKVVRWAIDNKED